MRKLKGIEPGEFDKTKRLKVSKETSIYHGDRMDFEYYEKVLGLSLEDLKGKRVLDIGGAPNGTFAKEATNHGVNVVTMNPNIDLGDRGFTVLDRMLGRDQVPNGPDVATKPVGGLAQELPFADNSFDIEISVGSVPVYLPRFESEYRDAFNEIVRTLKPGGKAFLFPIIEGMKGTPVFDSVVSGLEGCTVEFVELPGFVQRDNYQPVIIYRMIITKNL